MKGFELIEASDSAGLAICMDIRRRVFMEEQGVEECLETDGHDVPGEGCRHFFATAGGVPAGAFRCLDIGGGKLKLQRFCVLPDYRRRGLGRFMLERFEQEALDRGFTVIGMGAQCHAVPFYEKCGYRVVSGVFQDAGIDHVKMEKLLK